MIQEVKNYHTKRLIEDFMETGELSGIYLLQLSGETFPKWSIPFVENCLGWTERPEHVDAYGNYDYFRYFETIVDGREISIALDERH